MSKINIRDWKETSKREDRKIAKKQKKTRKMKENNKKRRKEKYVKKYS